MHSVRCTGKGVCRVCGVQVEVCTGCLVKRKGWKLIIWCTGRLVCMLCGLQEKVCGGCEVNMKTCMQNVWCK